MKNPESRLTFGVLFLFHPELLSNSQRFVLPDAVELTNLVDGSSVFFLTLTMRHPNFTRVCV